MTSTAPLTKTTREVLRSFSDTIDEVRYLRRTVNVTRRGRLVAVISPPPEPQARARGDQ